MSPISSLFHLSAGFFLKRCLERVRFAPAVEDTDIHEGQLGQATAPTKKRIFISSSCFFYDFFRLARLLWNRHGPPVAPIRDARQP
jgi:hypothetical protein